MQNFSAIDMNASRNDIDIGASEINGTIMLEAGEFEEQEVTLKIGDLVSLHVPRLEGYVSAEGILDAGTYLSCPPDQFETCIFQICLRNRVSAAEELAEYENRVLDGEDIKPSFMDTLRRVKANEQKLNASLMREKCGTDIKYGDVIQLKHMPSGKFLTISPNEVAKTERENLRVFLCSDGSTYSWFTLEAGRAMASGRALVDNNSDVVLAITARDNEYLHFADEQICHDGQEENKLSPTINGGDDEPQLQMVQHEVNCSLARTSFRMKLFTQYKPVANEAEGLLHAGELVLLSDPESNTFLRLLEENEKAGLETQDAEAAYFDKQRSGTDSFHSGALWLVERVQSTNGGDVHYGDLFTFRHLNSGRYLLMRSESVVTFDGDNDDVLEEPFSRPVLRAGGDTPVNGRNMATMPKGTCGSTSLREAECALAFEPFSRVGLEDSNVRNSNMVLLHSEAVGSWLCRGGRHAKLQMSRAEMSYGEEDRDEAVCLVVKRATDEMARDARTPLSGVPVLRKYMNYVSKKDVERLCHEYEKVKGYLESMIGFCLEGGYAAAESDGVLQTIHGHQTILKQQGIVDVLLDILEKETPLLKHAASMTHSDLKALERLCRKCFQTLHIIILKHEGNQLYVADRFTVIIAYLGKGSVAMRTITEMLGTNMEIQEDKVGQKEVETFISMLRESRMNFTILKLLSALCSCQGVGIDSNQTLLATLLLDQADELLAKLVEKNGQLYCSPPGGGGKSKGEGKEVSHGDLIPLTALAQKRNRELLKFFVAQLYMYAEMCFDRNYIAMQLLQEQLPYSWVVSAINMPEISEELRAAFTRLAHTMYIDCKPQEKFNTMNLTFCWSALKKGQCELPAISHEPENGVDGFKAMQAVITNHLAELKHGGQWSLFTYQAVASLEALIQFKFYSNEQELMSVVEPLINGLNFMGSIDLTAEQLAAATTAARSEERRKMRQARPSLLMKKLSMGSTSSIVDGTPALLADPNGVASKYQSGKVVPDDEDEAMAAGVLEVKVAQVERRVHRSEAQQKMLNVLNSLPALIFILCLVFVAITSSLVVSSEAQQTTAFKIYDYCVFAAFALELVLRLWAVNDTKTFMADPMAVMDAFVVGLDVLLMAAEDLLSAIGGVDHRSLRAVRLARLVRLLKLARLGSGIKKALEVEKTDIKWDVPQRYRTTPEGKLLTMIQMVKTLINVSNMCGSYRLTMVLAKIKEWHLGKGPTADIITDETGDKITELLDETISEGKSLGLESAVDTPDKVNDILLDLCLYEEAELVHNSLTLLMLHHTPLRALQRDARASQLMVRSEEEKLYKQLEELLSELQRSAESEEIWGGLETAEHVAISDRVKDVMRKLIGAMRMPAPKLLTQHGLYVAKKEVQTVVRNLGGFSVAMTVMQLTANLDGTDGDDEDAGGDMGENAEMENTKEILRLCCAFLCWLIHDNPSNQEFSFSEFDEFRSHISEGIGCAQVITQMLNGNEKLIKSVGDDFIEAGIELILTQGREPEYLEMLNVCTHIDEQGVRAHQIVVVQELTEPGHAEKVLYLPGAPGTPMYEERRQMMQQFAAPAADAVVALGDGGGSSSNISKSIAALGGASGASSSDVLGEELGLSQVAHLPGPLRYHTMLVMTLAGCAAGMINIVEAKVQSLCSFQNVLYALLDPDTVTEVRTALARFFYDVIIDVQILVPMLCENEQVWAYISTFPEVLERACIAIETLERELGYSDSSSNSDRSKMRKVPTKAEAMISARLRPERALLCYCLQSLTPICVYFFTNYYDRARTPWHQDKIECLMGELYTQLNVIYCMDSPVFMDEDKEALHKAAFIVYNKCSEESQASLPPMGAATQVDSNVRKSTRKGSMSERMMDIHNENEKKRDSVVEQDAIKDTFTAYLGSLDDHEGLEEAVKLERSKLIRYLKDVPRLGQEGKFVEFRFEPLLEKLVKHIRENLTYIGAKKVLSQEHSDTALWVMQLFRGMIEHEWGFSIDERDDEGDEDSDEKVEATQVALNDCGATALCLDLIADGIENSLVMESVRLLIALLYREGGCLFVQKTIFEHLNNPDTGSQYFFAKVNDELKDITAWHVTEWQTPDHVFTHDEEEEPAAHDSLIIVRFLQLCCEGHYGPNQDIFRTQPRNPDTYNLLSTLVEHTSVVSRMECRVSTQSLAAVTDTILEVIQGPCVGNQFHFAINTELLETLNRMIRTKSINDQVQEEEDEVKVTCMCIFKALVEAQPSKGSMIYDRILSVVHVEVLEQLITGRWGKPDDVEDDVEPGDEMDDLQIQSLVLMQMLTAYQPELVEDMANADEVQDMLGDQVVGVEMVWDGVLQQRYFPVPEMCQTLSDPSKNDIVQNVDRSSLELSLEDFVRRTHMMHVELQHEMWMKSMGLGAIFSRSSQNNSTWIAFFLCVFCNLIALYSMKYVTADGTHALPGDADASAVDALRETCEAMKSDNDFSFAFYEHASGSDNHNFKCERLVFTNNWHSSMKTSNMQYIVNIGQITVASFTMILYFAVRVPVIYMQKHQIDNNGAILSLIYAITDPLTVYYVLYVVICVMALNISPIWSSLLLMDIVVKSPTTADVLMAVIKPIKQLMMTVILGTFMLFIFAFVTFLAYHNDMPDDECNNLMRCFQLTVDFGMRSSGGVGDYMDMDRAALGVRNLLDLLYFIIILVILLNIIFGIIIDTFSELRQEKLERVNKTINFCFICGRTKLEFDRHSIEPHGFLRHIKDEHYMWNYLRFMIFLWEQDQDDDDGLELYVRKCLEKGDYTWFPMNRAMCFEQDGEEKEKEEEEEEEQPHANGVADAAAVGELRTLVEEMKKAMEEKLDKVDKQVSQAVAFTPAGGMNLVSSPSFRLGQVPRTNSSLNNVRAAQQQQQQRANMQERAQAQQQAEDLPPLS